MVSLLDRWLATTAADPDALAIDDVGRQLSRRELRQQVANLAVRLPVRPGDVVALHLEHGADFVIGVLAAWWRGAAFVPILPSLPETRRALLADQAGAAAVVGAALGDRLTIAVNPGLAGSPVAQAPLHPGNLAWVIHTSGSTGTPRAVAVAHRGLGPLVDAQIAAFDLRDGDRFLQVLSPAFDAAQSDLHTALCSGAALIFRRETHTLDGLRLALSEGITHVDLPPPLLAALSPDDRPATLRTIVVGGAPSEPAIIAAWAEVVRLVAVYGPTEASVCSHLTIADPSWDRPFLGEPIAGMAHRIVDGMLELAGAGLAEGYLGDPAATAAAFVIDEGERWYKTGDRVGLAGDKLVFLGRRDRQVSIAGHRVELAEVEAALRSAAPEVVALEHHSGRLIAVIEQGDPSREQAVCKAAEQLPTWMRPTILPVPALPRTPSGKPDVPALAAWPLSSAAPLTRPVEALLSALWSQALGGPIGPDDDLIERGADSLSILTVTARAEQAGWPIAPELWHTERTTRAVSAALSQQDGSVRAEVLRDRLGPIPDLSERGLPDDQPSHVLLTGATGTLGSAWLDALLHAGIHVDALVRAPSAELAAERVGKRHPNLRVVHGDLAKPQLGVSDDTWQHWLGRLDGVLHGGARVHSVAPWAELAPANVDGTRTLLRLCAEGRPKRFDLLSTLSVFVATDRNRGVAEESDDLSKTQRVWTGYGQTKWAAEVLCRSSCLPGLRIHRLGLLTGDRASGEGTKNDFLARFLRGVAVLGMVPSGLGSLALDVSPIDDVISALMRSLQAPPGTFHIAAPIPATLNDLVAALQQNQVRVQRVSSEGFAKRLAAVAHPDAHAAALALCRRLEPKAFGNLRALDLFQTTGIRFDTHHTQHLLGSPPVHPWDAALLARYAAAALRDLEAE